MSRQRRVTYLLVGGISFIVDFGVLVTCRTGLGLPVWAATTAAYWAGFAVNFTLQRTRTFAATGPLRPQLWRYGVLVLANYLGTLAIVDAASRTHIGYAVGKVLAVMVFIVVNYLVYGRWVFIDRSEPVRER